MAGTVGGGRGWCGVAALVLLGTVLVGCDVSDPEYVGGTSGTRVAIVGDWLTVLSADQLRAQIADEDALRIGATGGISVGSSLDRARDLAAGAPDVVVVQLGQGEAWNPQDYDGTAGTAPDPAARAALVDRTAGDLRTLFGAFEGSCTIGVTVAQAGVPDTFDPVVANAVNSTMRAEADVVLDLDLVAGDDPAEVVLDESMKLSEEVAQRYSALVADAVRECRDGPDGPLTVTTSTAAGNLRVAWAVDPWSVGGARETLGGPTATSYRVVLTDPPAGVPADRTTTSAAIDLPLDAERHAIGFDVGLQVTVNRSDGTVEGPLAGSFTFPAYHALPASTEWSPGTPTVVVDDATRRAAGLSHWVDGNIGFASIGGSNVGFAANGAGYSRWSSSASGFLGTVSTARSSISGLPADVNYAAGGPVYVDTATGNVVLLYHGEKYPAGDPYKFYGFIGMAVSRDGGQTFSDLGAIITPDIPMNSPARGWATEVGGAPYVVHQGYMYVYFRETTRDGAVLNVSVARATVSSVLTAARNGTTPTFTKRRSTWSTSATGPAAELTPGGPPPLWFDVVHLADSGRYLMVSSDGRGDDWTYLVRTSTDGVTWSSPTTVTVPTGGDETLYLSLSSPDRASQRVVRGSTVDLYRTRTDGEGWARWSGEVVLEKVPLTDVG